MQPLPPAAVLHSATSSARKCCKALPVNLTHPCLVSSPLHPPPVLRGLRLHAHVFYHLVPPRCTPQQDSAPLPCHTRSSSRVARGCLVNVVSLGRSFQVIGHGGRVVSLPIPFSRVRSAWDLCSPNSPRVRNHRRTPTTAEGASVGKIQASQCVPCFSRAIHPPVSEVQKWVTRRKNWACSGSFHTHPHTHTHTNHSKLGQNQGLFVFLLFLSVWAAQRKL